MNNQTEWATEEEQEEEEKSESKKYERIESEICAQ